MQMAVRPRKAKEHTIRQAIERTMIEAEDPKQLYPSKLLDLYDIHVEATKRDARRRLEVLRSLIA